ncbi:MAG: type II toxin-antitoxin system mRNA interferase toxin, RelE/StbE family [Candidatus Diapherotrites archaeon]
MAFDLETAEAFEKEYKKAVKKNSELKKAIDRKVKQILNEPHRFKPMHAPLHGVRRVHIMKSFVLIYSIKEKENAVVLLKFGHHDSAYEFRQ